jgi:hypothetical protein
MRAALEWKQKRGGASTELNPGAALRHLRPLGVTGSAETTGDLQHLMRSAIERSCRLFHNRHDKRDWCDIKVELYDIAKHTRRSGTLPSGSRGASPNSQPS